MEVISTIRVTHQYTIFRSTIPGVSTKKFFFFAMFLNLNIIFILSYSLFLGDNYINVYVKNSALFTMRCKNCSQIVGDRSSAFEPFSIYSEKIVISKVISYSELCWSYNKYRPHTHRVENVTLRSTMRIQVVRKLLIISFYLFKNTG